MFGRLFVRVMAITLLLAGGNAQASFHLWDINEVYSNASGTIQFIEFTTTSGSQQFLANHDVTSSDGVTTRTYTFATNLPGDSANKKFLMATSGFAALGIVVPDYIMPDGFLFTSNLTLSLVFADTLSNVTVPTDGVLSLNRTGPSTTTTATNSPTNFAGATGSIAPTSTRPGAPTITAVARGLGQVTLHFNPPSSSGTAPISQYNASCTPGNISASGSASPVVVPGLMAGSSYNCTVSASSSAGTGAPSPAVFAAPISVPDVPVLNSLTPGASLIAAYFTPVGDAGTPTTSFTVQCTSAMQPTRSASGSTSPIVVENMTDDESYTCSVVASNTVGNSAASNQLMATPSNLAITSFIRAVSRKTHAGAGTFDLPLNAQPIQGTIVIEPRLSADGSHDIVFQFNVGILAAQPAIVTGPGNPSVISSSIVDGRSVRLRLSGVPEVQRLSISLMVEGGQSSDMVTSTVNLGFLPGDINASRSVSAGDIVATKARANQTTNANNFLFDVNLSGSVSGADVSVVKARSGIAQP